MTNSTRYLLGVFAVFGVLSVVPNIPSLAQAPPESPGQSAGQARILELEEGVDNLLFLLRKLHRNSAAILEVTHENTGGSSSSFYDYFLSVCAGTPPDGDCPFPGSPSIQARLLVSDRGSIIDFNETTDADFPAIVALLTNGELDTVNQSIDPENASGAGFAGRESEFFESVLPLGDVDFAGIDIDQIRLKVNDIFFSSVAGEGGGFRNRFNANVFYELSDSQ